MGLISNFFGSKKPYDLDSDTFGGKILNDKNAVILDVRTKEEHVVNRIPNSILIDIYQPDFLSRIDQLDRSKNYYIYCRSGSRSGNAINHMVRMGFERVYHLQYGIISWNGETENG